MMIFNLEEIKKAQKHISVLVEELKSGYVKYSTGQTTVPPVGHLDFENPTGNTFIKFGHVHGDPSFVIKLFTGFPGNAKLGLPTSDGMNIVFDRETGMTKAILLDKGWLTSFRTAAASVLCAQYLAPSKITAMGLMGTGTLARTTLEASLQCLDIKKVVVYGYTKESTDAFVADFKAKGVDIEAVYSAAELCRKCNYIVTATNTKTPLITADMVKPGTHITAMGADGDNKNEVASSVFAKADIIVNDSVSQCEVDGDTSFAIRDGVITADSPVELGLLIKDDIKRADDEQITLVDLTGIAVQDIIVAEMVCDCLLK